MEKFFHLFKKIVEIEFSFKVIPICLLHINIVHQVYFNTYRIADTIIVVLELTLEMQWKPHLIFF
jgi:hypothetical protein